MKRFGNDRGGGRGGGGSGGFRGGGRRDSYGGGGESRGYGSLSGGSGSGGSGSFEKPVKEGQEYDVTIESVGAKGDGVCKINNFVVFVPGATQGARMRVRVTKVFSRFAVAEDTGSAPGATSSTEAASGSTEETELAEEGSEDGEEEEFKQ